MICDLYFLKDTTTFAAALPAGVKPGYAKPWPFDCVESVEVDETDGDVSVTVIVNSRVGKATVYSREMFPELDV